MIYFSTRLYDINNWTVLLLPKAASVQLPSRGLTMINGTLNNVPFKAALEPDGRGSHWFKIDSELLKQAHLKTGDTVKMSIEPTKAWLEPEIPADLNQALTSSLDATKIWQDITPLARWDWIRWIRAVKTAETRQKHIKIMISKLKSGMRRPCCFNRSLCSEPTVSHNWVLMTKS